MRHRAQALEQLAHRRRAVDHLAGDHPVAGLQRVAQPQLDRIQSELRGQPVHLRLVRDGHLDGAEPAHGAARRVVGEHDAGVDLGAADAVRPGGEAGRVADHGGRRRRVRAAVEQHLGLHVDQLAVAVRAVLVAQPRRVAVDVAVERLLAGCRPSSPAGGCAARAGRRGSGSTRPPGRRTRRRRPPGAAARAPAAATATRTPGRGRRGATASRRAGRRRRPPPGSRGPTRARGTPGPASRPRSCRSRPRRRRVISPWRIRTARSTSPAAASVTGSSTS